jgi:hypothetical protein
MPKVKDKIKITDKQKRLVEEVKKVIDRGEIVNKKEVLAKSGYTGTTLSNPSQVFSSENMAIAFIQAGLTPHSMAKTLDDAKQAKKGTFYKGEYCESDKDDHDVRLKALNLQAEMLGIKKQVIEQKSINVNVEFDDIKEVMF